MRKLTDQETAIAKQFFDKNRDECKNCRYTFLMNGRLECGMVHFDCIVTKPECLEVI